MHDNMILERAWENLDRAISNTGKASLPSLGSRWQTYALECQQKVRSFRTPIEAIHFAQLPNSHGGFDCRLVGDEIIAQAAVEDRNLRELFPEFGDQLQSFNESPFSQYDSLQWFGGRLVSSDLFKLMRFIMRCIATTKPERVLEIGGGYGAPGRLWLTNGIHNPHVYIDVDLPESLFFAEVWLSLHFGMDEVLYLHDESDVAQYQSQEPSIVLAAPTELDLVRSLKPDLVVNTRSFAEMSSEFCDFYIDWIERSEIDTLYSFNFFGQDLNNLREGMNYFVPALSDNWHVRYRNVAGQHPYTSAELVFYRGEGPSKALYANKLNSLLGRDLNQSSYVDAIDATRFVESDSHLMNLIKVAHRSFGYFPKEVFYLAKKLIPNPSLDIASADTAILDEIDALVPQNSRETRQTADVSPHLIPLRDQITQFELISKRREGFLVERSGEMHLVLDGEVVRIGPNMGVVELFNVGDYQTILSGWCANNATDKVGEEVLWFVGNRLLCSFATNVERRDVSINLSHPEALVGFQISVPSGMLPEGVAIGSRFFARATDNSIGELCR